MPGPRRLAGAAPAFMPIWTATKKRRTDKLPNANYEQNHGLTSLLPQPENPRDPFNLYYPWDLDETNDRDNDDVDFLTDDDIFNILDVFPGWKLLITVQKIISGMAEVVARTVEDWDDNGDWDYTTENPGDHGNRDGADIPGNHRTDRTDGVRTRPVRPVPPRHRRRGPETHRGRRRSNGPGRPCQTPQCLQEEGPRGPGPEGERVGDQAATGRNAPRTREQLDAREQPGRKRGRPPRSVKKPPCGPPRGKRRPESLGSPTSMVRNPSPPRRQSRPRLSRSIIAPGPWAELATPTATWQGGPA